MDQHLQIWRRSFKKLICVWSVCRFIPFRFQLCRSRHGKSPPCEKWHSPPWEFSCYKIPFSWLAETTPFPPKHRKLRQIAQTLSLRQDCKPYSKALTNCSMNLMTAELCKNYHSCSHAGGIDHEQLVLETISQTWCSSQGEIHLCGIFEMQKIL